MEINNRHTVSLAEVYISSSQKGFGLCATKRGAALIKALRLMRIKISTDLIFYALMRQATLARESFSMADIESFIIHQTSGKKVRIGSHKK